MDKLTLRELLIENKQVLLRVDLNVPMKNDVILDDTRIKAVIPTIRYLLERNAKVILMSHFGRPKTKDPKFSLSLVAKALSKFLDHPVKMAPDCIGKEVRNLISKMNSKDVVLLENLRFHEAEKHPEKDLSFAEEIASYGEIFVNDAFGSSHRKHSSVYVVPQYFPTKAAAGFLMEREIDFFGKALLKPKYPFVALLGGAKISTKIGVIKALLRRVSHLLLAGGIGFTFAKAQGLNTGGSLCEEEALGKAKECLEEAKKLDVSIIIPKDVVAAKELKENCETKVISLEKGIPNDFQGYDIGPDTIAEFASILNVAKTVFWNGPVGVYEVSPFNKGSFAMAGVINKLNAVTIVGGGDAGAVVKLSGKGENISHISTGGGASLEFIEQGSLPGVEVLSNNHTKEF